MITPNFTNRGQAKAKFFVVYAVSVLLIFLILSTLFKTGNAAETGEAVSGQNSHRKAIDEALHQQLQSLQAATVFYLENGRPAEGLTAVEREKQAFVSTVDNFRKSIATVSDAKEKAELVGLLSAFTAAAETQDRLLKTNALAGSDSSSINNGAADAEINELKRMLVEKEEKLISLEKQVQLATQEKGEALAALQNRPAAQPANDAAAAEWKERYNRLKASTDRSSSQLEALKASYKQVVDDNRRLITQLQAARSGKN